ncbi:hypothetical protein [Natronomonas marina]|jgi:hypothetical protein|uniref:hypothetical protein n=1 Tax=Natronomonas marina TaxID=2961939 RepID=UPI0020C9A732|nr:hypothetical protein [Natronomonas marina]
MALVGILGVSDATFGAVLTVAWLLILGATADRYRRGTLAGPKAALMAASAAFWLGFGLLQVSTAVEGAAELVVVGVAAGCFLAGVAAGYRWWTTRDVTHG